MYISCAVPVIANVNGACFTAGLELVLNCDIVVAGAGSGPNGNRGSNGNGAIFCDTHVRYGIMPSGGASVKLPRVVGINNAKMMVFMSKKVDARTAYSWGLVNILVNNDTHDDDTFVKAKAIGRSIHPSLHNSIDKTLLESITLARKIASNGGFKSSSSSGGGSEGSSNPLHGEVLRGYKQVMQLGLKMNAHEAHLHEKKTAYEYYKNMPQDLFENMKKFKNTSSDSAKTKLNASLRPRM